MLKDISNKEDIKLIITHFYEKLLNDPKMYPFFKEIVSSNHLEKHLNIITEFWNDIIFDKTSYKNNVMKIHQNTNELIKFERTHFETWISYFSKTVDTYFKGENSERMKNRANSVATVMQIKMNLYS